MWASVRTDRCQGIEAGAYGGRYADLRLLRWRLPMHAEGQTVYRQESRGRPTSSPRPCASKQVTHYAGRPLSGHTQKVRLLGNWVDRFVQCILGGKGGIYYSRPAYRPPVNRLGRQIGYRCQQTSLSVSITAYL